MHTLLFHQPGHFHAALLLRWRYPRVDRSIHVYATPGPDLERFIELVAGFNDRPTDPTNWNVEVHRSDDPSTALIDERLGDSVVVAGPTSTKLATIRRLHEAGINVLADKPWITSGAGIADLEQGTAGPPLAMDIMTERHDTLSRLRRRVVATESVFGHFIDHTAQTPALEFESVHHFCKTVDGRPLRRPPWYYDVRLQGDGLVDIHSHMVDQAQWLIGDSTTGTAELDRAVRWSTRVPLSTFAESTGEQAFPPSLQSAVSDGVLHVACNGQIDYQLGDLRVRHSAVWHTHTPPGGGDAHRSIVRGTGAEVIVQNGPETGHRTEIQVASSDDPNLADRLAAGLDEWRAEFPGLDIVASPLGWQLMIPASLATPHETVFLLVLDEFLDRVELERWPAAVANRIRTRYTLLAQAHEEAIDRR